MKVNWQWKMICYYYDKTRKATNELIELRKENEYLKSKILNMESELVVEKHRRGE